MCGEQNWLCRVRSSAPCRTGAWHKLAQQPWIVVEYFPAVGKSHCGSGLDMGLCFSSGGAVV